MMKNTYKHKDRCRKSQHLKAFTKPVQHAIRLHIPNSLRIHAMQTYNSRNQALTHIQPSFGNHAAIPQIKIRYMKQSKKAMH